MFRNVSKSYFLFYFPSLQIITTILDSSSRNFFCLILVTIKYLYMNLKIIYDAALSLLKQSLLVEQKILFFLIFTFFPPRLRNDITKKRWKVRGRILLLQSGEFGQHRKLALICEKLYFFHLKKLKFHMRFFF